MIIKYPTNGMKLSNMLSNEACQLEVAKIFSDVIHDWYYEKYLFCGGFGSGKSYDVALKITLKALQEVRRIMVVRNVYATHKDSTYSLLKEILFKMDMATTNYNNRTKVYVSPRTTTLRFPNGSEIIFKGADDVEKLKSLNNVSIVWIEECTELSYEAYKMIDMRARHPEQTVHIILTCNPIGKENWVYKEFFVSVNEKGEEKIIQDEEEFYRLRILVNNNVYYHHSTVDDNPFMVGYDKKLDTLRDTDPQAWKCARFGRFGAAGNRVLRNLEIATNAKEFTEKVRSIPTRFHFYGLDFGFEKSYNALVSMAVDKTEEYEDLYIYDEIYRNGLDDEEFVNLPEVQKFKNKQQKQLKEGKYLNLLKADHQPGTIRYFQNHGFQIKKTSAKYQGSRLENTKKMKRFRRIIVSPKCVNTIRELKDLTYAKDRNGNLIYDEFNIDPHTFSAIWYALDNYEIKGLKSIQRQYTKAGKVA